MTKKQQQIVAFAFGVIFVVVMLTIALVVQTPTAFQYVVFRVVLSLAAAGVAAMVPGFIELTVPGVVRAGGALAVFAVVYFYNPVALVADIEPLKDPVDITPKSLRGDPLDLGANTVLSVRHLLTPNDQANSALHGTGVAQLLEGRSKDKSSRLFDLTLSNATDSLLLLNRFQMRWRYNRGVLLSVDRSATLVPIAKYIVDIPVDTDDEEWHELSQVMNPSIALKPGAVKDPTLVTVRLQLHYHFAGRLKYHPSADWNIHFDLVAVSSTGQQIVIFDNATWK